MVAELECCARVSSMPRREQSRCAYGTGCLRLKYRNIDLDHISYGLRWEVRSLEAAALEPSLQCFAYRSSLFIDVAPIFTAIVELRSDQD